MNNEIFWSVIGSEFGDLGPQGPQGFFSTKIFVCMTYGGYAIFVLYVGVEAKLRRSENFLYDLVQELFVARHQFLNQVLGGERNWLKK